MKNTLSINRYLSSKQFRPFNKKIKWYSSDEETFFLENKYNLNSSTIEYYKKNPILYDFNEFGFRCGNETKNDIDTIFLGDSHTVGVGHHIENTWGYKTAGHLDTKFYTISEPAIGSSGMFRLIYYYLNYKSDIFKNVKKIIQYLPAYNRFEFFNGEKFEKFQTTVISEFNIKFDNFVTQSLLTDEQRILNDIISCNAIQNLCKTYNIDYYLITDNDIYEFHRLNIPIKSTDDTEARDGVHYSSKIHNTIFEIAKYKLNNNLYEKHINEEKFNLKTQWKII